MNQDSDTVSFEGVVRPSTASFAETSRALSELVLAWASDAQTGAAKYILEVETGIRCGCVCPGCGGRLEAVNARNPRWKIRPHFRHSNAPQTETCRILAARAALLRTLTELDTFELPGRRRNASVVGLSGATYEAHAVDPSFVAAPEAVSLVDSHQALVTLRDGRDLLVQVQASLDRLSDVPASQRAVIRIVSDSPELAALAPDELRERLRILFRGATWCQQWNDAELDVRALKSALEKSDVYLDGCDGEDHTSTYEGALHRAVKEILAQHLWMMVPGVTARVCRDGIGGQPWIREWASGPARLTFREARLEKRVGRSVPDVVAASPDGPICIEITVTNPLTNERESSYREMGLPVLELDLRTLSGRVTREQLVDLVLTDVRFKRWAYHPLQVAEQNRMLEAYQAEIGRYHQNSLAELLREAKDLALDWYNNNYRDDLKAPLVRVLEHIEDRGYAGAASRDFYGFHAILPRLMTIAFGRPVGYRYSSVFEVINALASSDDQRWSTLYLMALKRFAPQMSTKHQEWVANWRETILERVRSGDAQFDRPLLFDRTIAAFFPEMEGPLSASLKYRTASNRISVEPQPANISQHFFDSGAADKRGKWVAIIEGKPYTAEGLHEYLFGEKEGKRH